jgi:hypothetical protein
MDTNPKDDSDKLDKILGHLDSLHTKHDALCARMDAMESTVGGLGTETARKDAEKAEDELKARADAERATATEADRGKFAAAQMRADAAYQAWSKQAPHALHGETLRDFRERLLNPLKQHSRTYKDSALALVGDDAAFSVIEDMIIKDAIAASNTSYTADAPLRKVVTRADSGHLITKWVGDPLVAWAPFSGGAARFGRINPDLANRARSG